MQIETTRFGRIDVPDEAVIHFPRGLYGLDGTRHYCLLRHDERGYFHWLQAADAPAVAMVVTDPFLHFPTYQVDISDQANDLLQARAATDVTIYTSISVAADGQAVFANLLGPLVINPATRLGLQLIQDSSRYTTRHRLDLRRPVEEAA
jgi:flagellar assembly factor FliW